MKSALVAFDPLDLGTQEFENFCQAIRLHQDLGILENIDIVSVVHPEALLLSKKIYRKDRLEIEERIKLSLLTQLGQKFRFKSVQIHSSRTAEIEEDAEIISKVGQSLASELLVLGGSNRSLLSYLTLGSFAETTSRICPLPVMVLRLDDEFVSSQKKPTVVVAVPPMGSPGEHCIPLIIELVDQVKGRVIMALSQCNGEDISDWSLVNENLTYGLIRNEFEEKNIEVSIRKGRKSCLSVADIAKISREEEALVTVFCPDSLEEKPHFLKPSIRRQVVYEMTNSFLMLKKPN